MCLSNLLFTFSFFICRCSFLKQSVVKKRIVSKRKESICKDMHASFEICIGYSHEVVVFWNKGLYKAKTR
jgi:hypothetical protein